MSYPRYSDYKDNKVQGLGKVPSHWKVLPLKAVSTHNDDVLTETTVPDTEISYVDISSVDGVNGIKTKESMLFSAAPSRARRLVKHGDVIVSTVRTYLKAIARIRDPEDNLVVSTGFAVIRPRSELTPDFLGCLVFASYFVDQVISRSTGVSYPAINASELVAISVPIPPINEQIKIALFVDRETAKIDELSKAFEGLISLLKEKRQAVISHAVTKGLDPSVPMKDSGIEWLGQVPTSWTVTKTARFFKIAMGQTILKENLVEDGSWPVFSATEGDHYFGRINEPQVRLISGDIVIPARGNSIGFVKLVKEPSTTTQTTIYCKHISDGKLVPAFFFYFLKGGKDNLFFFTQTAIPQITVEEVRSNPILIPSVEEQLQIAAFLDVETSKIDDLINKAMSAIDLLKERRTALISAAVTGKIDVRGLVNVDTEEKIKEAA